MVHCSLSGLLSSALYDRQVPHQMFAASNIIFQECVLHPRAHLRGFVVQLLTFGDNLKILNHPAPILSCCLFVAFFLCRLVFSQPRMSKQDQFPTRVALQALAAVVVPTCSLWPNRYIELASVVRSHIKIPLEVLFKDIVNDVIELRNPSNDLAELIGPGTVVNEHTISLDIGWVWWIRYFEWMFTEFKSERTFRLSGWPYDSTPTTNLTYSDPLLRTSALPSSTLDRVYSLDPLPHGVIPILSAGYKVTLEFTTFSTSLRKLSKSQIISAIPFIVSRRRPRPLASVLGQLNASYGPNMVVDSILNVSTDYEHALHDSYKSLCKKQKIRWTMVKVLGFKTRRLEMFLVALEAALVRRGWIERWAIQVTVK